MFDKSLIESAHREKSRATWLTGVISIALHAVVLGGVVTAGYWVSENPEVLERPIEAFIVGSPPPPPPPPPPPGGSSTPVPSQPDPTPEPESPRDSFVQPEEVPKDLPPVHVEPSEANEPGGVVGGVAGGVPGGVVGGVIGGVVGGTLGGTLGGVLGGTGTGPVRVGGNVKPPLRISSVDPVYTEDARKARVQGVVILEAIIDAEGNVRDVRVLKPLPQGLDQAAIDAVRQWKFKPGTEDGRPVAVIYNLTVNFRLQ